MSQNISRRSKREEFLDNYFVLRLQQLIDRINLPELQNRREHVEHIYESLMDIADEYQAVMIEDEQETYWGSIDRWDDELKQQDAIRWVNDRLHE